MSKGRLEAFSDGVLAIIITIMVLEIKVPHGDDLHAIAGRVPTLASYVLSFIYVGIYWNNHHHLMHATKHVSGGVMWGNLHLLFWLSLIPVVSAWAGEYPYAPWPAVFYGIVLFMSGIAWLILQYAIIHTDGPDSPVARAVGRDWKGKISAVMYLTGIGLAFVRSWIACLLYAVVATIWLVPDRRIERELVQQP